jgi:hypothetical protein
MIFFYQLHFCTRRNPPTCRKSLTNRNIIRRISKYIMLYFIDIHVLFSRFVGNIHYAINILHSCIISTFLLPYIKWNCRDVNCQFSIVHTKVLIYQFVVYNTASDLNTVVLSVLFSYTDFDYPFGIFKLFLRTLY